MDKLTDRQQRLCDACTPLQRKTVINIIKGMSQRQSYKKAGGKASGRAADAVVCRMLTNANAKAFYDSLLAREAHSAVMTRDRAMVILSNIAEVREDTESGYKVAQVLPAVKQLATMEGWDSATKYEHSGADGGPIEITTDIELARKLAFLLTKGEK